MRKIRFKSRSAAVLAAAVLPILAAAGVITYTASYDNSKLTLGTDTLGGVTYTTVRYDGLYNGWEPGAPLLPIDYLCFSVPYNATDYTVTATVSGTVTHNTSYLVYPCQQHDWYNGGTVPITSPDNTIYYSNAGYPTQRAWVVKNGFLAGENRIVTVAVMPIAFLHSGNNNSVSLSTNVNISLNYELNKSQSVAPLVRNDRNLRKEGHEITMTMVVNPDDVVANAPLSGSNNFNSSMVYPDDSISEPYSYLIITTPDYVHVMRKLAALKRQKGYTVKVTTWQDAIAQPYASMGDSIPLLLDNQFYIGATDDAGKLRQFIRYHYLHHGTEYVLLAGASVPHRDFDGGCTDMYFSDLGSYWDNNAGSGATVYVGRLLGNTEGQFDNYNDKLFRYELDPGNGNPSYLRRELAFEAPNYDTELGPLNSLLPDVTEIDLQALDYYVSGSEFIGTINNNHYGFIATFADGDTTYFTLNEDNGSTSAHYIWAQNNVRDPLVTDNETGNALDCLSNKQYPMVFFSGYGKTMAYHDNPQLTIDKSLGASFTMGKDYGGPVYMGLTKDISELYSAHYFFSPFSSYLTDVGNPIGKSYALAKPYPYSYNSPVAEVYVFHNYLGDPSVILWDDTPQNYSNIILTRGDSSITISGITEASTILALYSNDGNTLSQKTSDSSFTFSHVSPNSTVTLYKRNCIPYIAPLVIQNTTLNKSQYVIASDVTAGKAVDNNRTSGQVTVTGDIEYEIEHTGEVRFCGGFKVNKGVKFSVKPSTYNK